MKIKAKTALIYFRLFRFWVFKNHSFNTNISAKNPYIWGENFKN